MAFTCRKCGQLFATKPALHGHKQKCQGDGAWRRPHRQNHQVQGSHQHHYVAAPPPPTLDERIHQVWGPNPTVTLGIDPATINSPAANNAPAAMSQPDTIARAAQVPPMYGVTLPIPPQLAANFPTEGLPPLPDVPSAPGKWSLEQQFQVEADGARIWQYTWKYRELPLPTDDTTN